MNNKQRHVMRLQARALRRAFDYHTGTYTIAKWLRKNSVQFANFPPAQMEYLLQMNDREWKAMTLLEHARDGQLARLFRQIKRMNKRVMDLRKAYYYGYIHFASTADIGDVVGWDDTKQLIADYSGLPKPVAP